MLLSCAMILSEMRNLVTFWQLHSYFRGNLIGNHEFNREREKDILDMFTIWSSMVSIHKFHLWKDWLISNTTWKKHVCATNIPSWKYERSSLMIKKQWKVHFAFSYMIGKNDTYIHIVIFHSIICLKIIYFNVECQFPYRHHPLSHYH